MNLTEPGAGSDVGALRTTAEPITEGPHAGQYRITGQKIYITWGEHDLADNIIHLVLARLPGAPEGSRGISLFVVPKYHVNADGTLGPHNDLRCVSLEHKLGINASPTCVMSYGDNGDCIGELVGHENKGLAAMFTMMNNARINVGNQGVQIEAGDPAGDGLCPRPGAIGARQVADKTYVAIIEHPDVRRMILRMKGLSTGVAADSGAGMRGPKKTAGAGRAARTCSRRSPRPGPQMSAVTSPPWACRSTAAWASSRRPARPNTVATPASPRSTRAPTASRPMDLVGRKLHGWRRGNAYRAARRDGGRGRSEPRADLPDRIAPGSPGGCATRRASMIGSQAVCRFAQWPPSRSPDGS